MAESKTCPKCDGPMKIGTLQQVGNYGNSPFVWAPEAESPFPVKGSSSPRKNLSVFRCENCGYLEYYAL
jgi:hypothetical protein